MNVLVTGSRGFIGKNLVWNLNNTHTVLEFCRDTPEEDLEEFCREADFVFHMAGVNRPEEISEFEIGNVMLTERLLTALERAGNRCPVMLASSIHAAGESAYGRSKRAAEELVFAHGARTGARVLVYRFPHVFGKWCRPDYNSVVATFCYRIARNEPVWIQDPAKELELVYIDDLLTEMKSALEGRPHRQGRYCAVPVTHHVTLGKLAAMLEGFRDRPKTGIMPPLPAGSLEKKLYSTYLSSLPKEAVAYPLDMKRDDRGSFTEILRTQSCGQFSVNISRPGVTKGQHWHNSKWELFVVVAGEGLIQQRKMGTDEVLEFRVSGEKLEAVHMLPGYTHSLMNLSQTENLVTLMWANEPFDPQNPDTFYERVRP